MQVFYPCIGDAANPVIVMLHGFPTCPVRKLKLEHIDGVARPRSATDARALASSYVRCQRRPGNKRPSLATGFASDRVHRPGNKRFSLATGFASDRVAQSRR